MTAVKRHLKSEDFVMEFEHTWKLLHLLWIVPLFGLLVYLASSRRKHDLNQIFGSHAEASSNSTLSHGKKYLRLWLLIAAIILIAVAIARPRWGSRILPFSGRGRDLMIVLDVSKSMNSEDVKPSRLKHAKLFLRNLIKDNPYDRFGLVAFAGSAFKECPLTVDKTSIFQALDEMNTDTIPLGGTNIENALNTALQAFQAAEGGYRAIVLITDGDELYGDSSRTIAELKRLKIPLFVVGIGDPTGDGLIKITGADGKTKPMRDAQGNLIKSKLNEKQLRKLAESTGKVSIYVRSTETDPELAAVNNKIKKLVPKEYSKGNNKRPIERFHYPLFAAVLLLLIRFGIGERKKINPALLLVCCLLFSGLAPSANAQQKGTESNPEKLELADEEKQEAPEKDEEKKEEKKEVTPVELYNQALERHYANDFKGAEKLYRQAINMSEIAPEVRSKAFQNLGVLSHQASRSVIQQDPDKALKILDRAEEMYKESMRSNTKRKKVVLNQQKLLDDRELAKEIKKHKEELQNKQKEAQKKTKEAHDKQKKENKEKQENKDQKDPKKDQQKDQKQQQNQQQNKNQNQKDQKDQKKQDKKDQKNQGRDDKEEPKDPKGGSGAGKQDQNDASGKTDQKIRDAQKACEELEKAAEKHKRNDVKKQAKEAGEELEKAKQEREKGNGKKAEEHLKNAMKKLKPSSEDKKDEDNQQQNKNNQKDKDEKQKDPNKKLEQNPEDPQQDPKDPKNAKEEKDIDPAQASALLDLMANDEKTLRDQIKENQKRDARVKKVLKDW